MQIYGTKTVATIGPRKVITITYPPPRETLFDVPIALPTSEPMAGQLSYMIEAGDLPTVGGLAAGHYKYTAAVYAAGNNTSGADRLVFFDLLINGSSVFTNTGDFLGIGQYWTISVAAAYDSHVGDVLELRVWADDAGVDFDYQALGVFVTRPDSARVSDLLLNAEYTIVPGLPALTLGTPSVWNIHGAVVTTDETYQLTNEFNSTGALTAISYTSFGLFQSKAGDVSSIYDFASDAGRPSYMAFQLPSDVRYYPTSIRVV